MAVRALHDVPARSRARGPRSLVVIGVTAAALAVPLTAASGVAHAQGTATAHVAATTTKSTAVPKTVRYNSRGPAVKRLQRLLHVRPVSGWFGPITLAAVKRFERNHHLKVDGVVDARTWRVLLRVKAATARASRSTRTPGRVCPVPGASFSDTYGAPRSDHPHAGVDMLAPKGTKIHAIESGTIVRAHWSGSSGGWTITLQGVSGSKFFHAHNSKNLVRAGQHVSVGQVIALVGSTGNAGAVNQLHFEYWKSGRESDPVDPTPLIRSLCR